MTEAEQIRARLDALTAAEHTNPSPVWAPIAHAGPCRPPFMARTRDCDCSRCCAAAPHEPGCSQPDAQECTCPDHAEYHLPGCPENEGDGMPNEPTAEETSLCHEATEFDHQCRVCATEDARPDECQPGIDF
ncbi:hypothetical protein G3I51_23675 [Streptomyces sp. SID9944]|nr:hypothetical protein [Streptomyces sp. SID9944]